MSLANKEKKIEDIISSKNFSNFWECFEYLKLASYDEYDAIKLSLELFKGDIWSDVITAYQVNNSNAINVNNNGRISIAGNSTYPTLNVVGYDTGDIVTHDYILDVHLMAKSANKHLIPMYKAYLKTRKYEDFPELDYQIKTITFTVDTHLGIELFKAGLPQFE